jgi:hypothetical protein
MVAELISSEADLKEHFPEFKYFRKYIRKTRNIINNNLRIFLDKSFD